MLGWEWRPAKLGDRFRIALVDGTPVAGIAAVASMWQMAVAWTPYFAVRSADEAVARVQERGGTAGGRTDVLPARAGGAAGRPGRGDLRHLGGRPRRRLGDVAATPSRPSSRLHTRDAFDAAIFYGEVLDWATERPGCCEVHYEGGEVVLRSRG